MKHLSSFLAGAAAGALLMYYLDAASGGRRRALVRDKLVSAGHDASGVAERQAKQLTDRVKGMAATRSFERHAMRPPETALQLHERIRSHLGRLVSHPGAVHVEIEGTGHVRLTGHVLAAELERLLDHVREMPGVERVQNALAVHESGEHVPQLQGRHEPAGQP